ncbi:MAG: alcohol dehydrogenase catalytic domain-containing protein, partial [Nitratireductor sp.]|nr:alcohol dehydrogenase catalytic domain-containing protein [Nitratireductor sp.]
MSVAETMFALTLREGGFSATAEGPAIRDLDTWLKAETIPVPQPGAGQVLVRLVEATINPSDLHFIKGEYGIPRVKGAPAGFEGCGTVVAAGAGAERLVGKRVGFVATASGAWAEYVVTDATSCVPVLDAVSDSDAAALFVNPLTAIAMFSEVKDAGSKCFIMSAAASQLCKLIAGLAREEGYSAVSLVRRDDQIGHLQELGATHVLNVTAPDFKSRIGEIMKSEKPRVFLDAVADQMSSDLFFAMPSRAQWVVYGKLSPELPVLSQPGQFIFMEK